MGAREVGIDVEKRKPDFPFADVAAHRFSAVEQRCLVQSADPRAAFYTLWTRQEARAKATGRGLGDAAGAEEAGWTTLGFEVAPGDPGAVAYPADWQPAVRFFTLEP